LTTTRSGKPRGAGMRDTSARLSAVAILVPYHLNEQLPLLAEELAGVTPAAQVVTSALSTDPPTWPDLVPLAEAVAEAVSAQAIGSPRPVSVISGCCTVSLGVLCGLQRAGSDPAIVWLDAHGDVHTPQTSTSGYLGGMPLRLAVGEAAHLVADAIRLHPVAEDRVLLVGARDLDAPEVDFLSGAGIRRSTVDDLAVADLPAGPLLLHIDLDVLDGGELPGLRFPTPGGPSAAATAATVRRILETGRVAALDIACTWDPAVPDASGARTNLVAALLPGPGLGE
jgi:arginase